MTLENNRFVTGYGMGETHALEVNDKEAGAKKPNLSRSAGKPYATICFDEIAKMAEAPIATKKPQAQWAIFSNYNRYDARSHDCQRANGEFWVLPVDLDKGAPDLETLVTIIKAAVGDVEALIYSSRSATLETPKWRVLIPLAKSIEGSAYQATQRALFDLLEEGGLTCDRALERTGQLVYLPNRGDYYAYQRLTGGRLDPTDGPLADRVAANRKAEERRLEEVRRVLSEQPPRSLDFDDSDNPMTWYNANHRLTDVLFAFGYTQDGASVHWRSPLQQSESFATMVDGERWVSLSGSDISAELGRVKDGQVTSGDAYDIYVHFEHGGDHAKAYKAIREMMPSSPRQHQNDLSDFEIVPTVLSTTASSPRELEPKPFCLRPTQDIPPRQWLYGRQFIRGFLSLTVAPGGLGKSSMLIAECLSMVTGKPILGNAPARPLNVWVWSGEDPYEETERRIAAACSHYGLSAADLGGRLRMDSGRDLPITLASYASGKVDVNAGQASELVKALQKAEIDVLIIDPFVTSHLVPENDTTGMNAVVATFRNIASKANCAIELVHHVSKNGAMNAQDMGIYASRGAGAVIDGVRAARQLIRMTQEQAEKFGVEKPSDYFSVNSGKANLAPLDKVEWRQMISVPLHNGSDLWPEGDWVGVCAPWTPPDAFDGVKVQDLKAVQDAIDALDEPPASAENAEKWVGFVVAKVLGLDVGEYGSLKRDRDAKQNSARARIRMMIKSWIKSEALLVEDAYSSRNGRKTKVVVVGEPVTAADLNP